MAENEFARNSRTPPQMAQLQFQSTSFDSANWLRAWIKIKNHVFLSLSGLHSLLTYFLFHHIGLHKSIKMWQSIFHHLEMKPILIRSIFCLKTLFFTLFSATINYGFSSNAHEFKSVVSRVRLGYMTDFLWFGALWGL